MKTITIDGVEYNLLPKVKFKLGDWIVQNDNGTVSQITKVINAIDEDGEYRAYEHTNGYFAACFENEYHLWSIVDARDGDILSAKIDGDGYILIFKQIKDGWIETYGHYYITIDKFCAPTQMFCRNYQGRLYPATQEQYKTLFKKMRDDGYEWDFDKKELRKIFNPKFKVGDHIKTGNTIETIAEVDHATRSYCCESGRTIWFENQDLWHLVPKSHYDIVNFHVGMPVLVRADYACRWDYSVFSRITGNEDWKFAVCNGVSFTQCIPFNDNTKHLLGTTDMCDERFINW